MSAIEKEEIINRIGAMSREEMLIALDHIPVDLCLERIKKEIIKSQAFIQAIKETTSMI